MTDHPAPFIARIAYEEAHRALDDRKGIRMGNQDDGAEAGIEVTRAFAGMLGEVEDLATRLTQRQAALARELAEVDAELQRVETVRSAMTGKAPKRHMATSTENRKRTRTTNRVEKITKWARERGGEFTGSDVADMLEIRVQGVGPILGGMVRRGEATVREDGHGRRFYTVA